ncbi:MAG: AAA family ATPase [Proteobacteria bacterium]|nr:AAA family ATPase [Pseudomonadota bacterium]
MRKKRRDIPASNQILVLAGPKGGVGRTTVAAELAYALASKDKRVLVVDLDAFGQGLRFELEMPPQTLQDATEFAPVPTSTPNLDTVLLNPKVSQLQGLVDRLHTMPYDVVIIDLRPEFSARDSRLFLLADVPVVLANGEPSSLWAAAQWIRYAIVAHLEHTPGMDDVLPYILPVRDAWDFVSVYRSLPADSQEKFVAAVSGFRSAFLLNGRREGSEVMQSDALCHAWGMQFGANVQVFGTLAYHERRWFFIRKHAVNNHMPQEGSIPLDLEPIVEQLIAGFRFDPQPCLPLLNVQANPRAFLRVDTFEETRQAYRKLWEGYRRENGLVSAVLPAETIKQTVVLLETAYRRAGMEAENAQAAERAPVISEPDLPVVSRELSGMFAAVKAYDAAQCPAEAGDWLAQKRCDAGMTPKELSLQTRIPLKIIEQLERRDVEGLSPPRLQAYLFEIAKVLEIPLEEVRRQFGFK